MSSHRHRLILRRFFPHDLATLSFLTMLRPAPRIRIAPQYHWIASPLLVLLLVLAPPLSTVAGPPATVEFSRISMGTKFRILMVADDEESAAPIAAAVFEQLDALEQAMSDWRDDSALAAVDRAAGGAAVEVPDALHRVLRLARRMSETTDGAFDPTVGPLVRLWRAAREEGAPPDDAAIDAAVRLVGWRDLRIGADRRVQLRRAGMRLDLGGIGKGFALDELAVTLRERGVESFLLDFGSVALASGAPAGRPHWTVAREIGGPLPLRDMAVAFSGDSEQAMVVDGERLGHIIDPASGAALRGPRLVMAVASEAAVADALSTAAAVLGPDSALRLVARLDECAIAMDVKTELGWRSVETPGLASLAAGGRREGEVPLALRRVRRGEHLLLEVPEIVFESVAGRRPPITLLGVAHIGEAKAYERLQRILDGHSGTQRSGEKGGGIPGLVLFESVLPDGARVPGGDEPDERIASTRATLELLAMAFGSLVGERGAEAVGAMEVGTAIDLVVEREGRNGPLLRPLARDAWGNCFVLEAAADDGDTIAWIVSFGADGVAGGDGEGADLRARIRAQSAVPDGGLQAELARMLGLEFQLDAMDYDRLHWRAADMTMSELAASAREHGADAGPLLGSIGGGSLPLTAVRTILRLVRMFDGFAGGMIRDTMRALMIELLSEPEVMAMADAQMGALMRVILDERNRVAMDALVEALETAPTPRSIALFYGAAHLPDLAIRLEAIGYRPTRIEWHPMIGLDLATSSVDERQLQQLRQTLRRMMR